MINYSNSFKKKPTCIRLASWNPEPSLKNLSTQSHHHESYPRPQSPHSNRSRRVVLHGLPLDSGARGADAAVHRVALAALVGQVVVGVGVSGTLAGLEEGLSRAIGIGTGDGVEAGGAIHLGALLARLEELDVAAGDGLVGARADDGNRVTVDVRNVDVGHASEGALDFGTRGVGVLADGDTASPSRGVYDLSGTGKLGSRRRVAHGLGATGVVAQHHGQCASVLVLNVDGQVASGLGRIAGSLGTTLGAVAGDLAGDKGSGSLSGFCG